MASTTNGTTPGTLPALLILAENGMWVTPSWGQTSDDDYWFRHGWKATTYDGHTLFSEKELTDVRKWIIDRGYVDTGDGRHFRRPEDHGRNIRDIRLEEEGGQ